MQSFLYEAVKFVLPDQLREFAHACRFARDIVIQAVRAIPRDDRNYPEETGFMRALLHSSLTALTNATGNMREDTYRIQSNDEYLIGFACRYDDLELTKFIFSKMHTHLNFYDMQLFLRAIPLHHRANELIYYMTSNRTSSWRIFAYLCEQDIQYIEYRKRKELSMNHIDYEQIVAFCIKKNVTALADAAIFANNVKLLRAIDHAFSTYRHFTMNMTSDITPYECAITDEVANIVCNSPWLRKMYYHIVSSFDQRIIQDDHPLFMRHNVLVDMRHIFTLHMQPNISTYALSDASEITSVFNAIWNMHDDGIVLRMISTCSNVGSACPERSYVYFSSMLRMLRKIPTTPSMLSMPIMIALIKTLTPVRILFTKYPDLVARLHLEKMPSFLANHCYAHAFLNIMYTFRYKEQIHEYVLNIALAIFVAQTPTEIENMMVVSKNVIHYTFRLDVIRELMSRIMRFHISIKQPIQQSIDFIKQKSMCACQHTVFAIGALIGDYEMMCQSGYKLDMNKYVDRVIGCFMLSANYIRAFGTNALTLIDPHTMTKHRECVVINYSNLTNSFGIIMQNASIMDLITWRDYVYTSRRFTDAQRLLLSVIIEALLRKRRISVTAHD